MEDFEYLSINSVSRISITQGPTKSQPSLVTISDPLNRCSFDLAANRQTNFFHMTLLTVEGILCLFLKKCVICYEKVFIYL